MARLDLNNIAKSYHAVDVIKNLNLAVDDGEFIVVVGPSGCGKSTLLRMIAGLESISGGDLLIDDKRANNLPPQKRNIAMVFQTYALFPHMNARQNISFGPEVRGESKSSSAEKIARAAEILGLTPYLDRRPSELSGGQRQRVAMARAIVRDSDLFLFDEPLSNLDAHLRADMRTEIKTLHRTLGSTIIYVTHDQIEAMTMADRIVIMNKGKIEQVGTPAELYDKPKNKFVAAFLGSPSMCFLPGKLGYADGVPNADLGEDIRIPIDKLAKPVEHAILGIRPESFVLDQEGSIKMTIDVVEPTGPEVMTYGRVMEQKVRCVFKGRPDVCAGQEVRMTVDPNNIHLFEPNTGNRL
jgi:multiple sugar transport system ATP-binding protein